MKYWLNAGLVELRQLVPIARAAEEAGFEGIAMPDHLFFPGIVTSPYPYSADGAVMWPAESPWPDCWVSIAVMAQATERLQFSTGVFVAPLRDPFALAKSAGTAAGLAGGRLSCGFGAGWLREEFDAVGIDFASRGSRLDEMIDVLRLLWTGEMVDHHGTHFDFGPVQMRPAAVGTPILIGGNSARALRRAARNDGWVATFTDVADVARMFGELERQRSETGCATVPFRTLVIGTPSVARHATALAEIGADAIVVPAVALGPTWSTADIIDGLDRFADRWMT